MAQAVAAMQSFTDFNADNDPRGEHDFGILDLDGSSFYFKIDYYDLNREGFSPDPSDPLVTARVLTILEASEY